ncbi:hypothetical protein ACQKWADRAFT_285919 [Trichoderma austrokoningii]
MHQIKWWGRSLLQLLFSFFAMGYRTLVSTIKSIASTRAQCHISFGQRRGRQAHDLSFNGGQRLCGPLSRRTAQPIPAQYSQTVARISKMEGCYCAQKSSPLGWRLDTSRPIRGR